MNELFKKFKVKIDYERQSFDNINANDYEIAVAVSKYAREVNDRARKYFGSDVDIQPRNLAMKKLENENMKIVYDEEKNELETKESPSE